MTGREALRPEPEAARALRESMLGAYRSGQSTWRGICLANLHRVGGGKMFGVMRARDDAGEQWRFAFSGQIDGRWALDGWEPPLFAVQDWRALERAHDPEIQELTRIIDSLPSGSAARQGLLAQRKAKSHALLDAYIDLYEVPALAGGKSGLAALFGGKRPPTGAGDCCAPKLLACAAREGLEVLGLSEIFLGASPRSGTRVCGTISPPCKARCGPILDFMLGPCSEDDAGMTKANA